MGTCLTLLWLSVAFLAFVCPTAIFGADVNVLLEIAALRIPPALSDWTLSNASNVCSWSQIYCNNQGNVIEIDLRADSLGKAFIAGVIPPSIANLTHLKVFRLNYNRIIGTVPPEFWQLPDIEDVTLSSTALTIRFPPVVSQSLNYLAVDDTLTSGPIPSLNWTSVDNLDFGDTNIECPLPLSLVNYFNSLSFAPVYTYCRVGRSRLWVEQATQKVCGQIHVSKFWCELYPLQEPIINFQQIPPPVLTPNHAVDTPSIRAEFYRDEVYFFGVYSQRNKIIVHRDEYVKFKMYGLSAQPDYIGPFTRVNRTNFAFTGFEAFNWNATSSELTAIGHAGPSNIFRVEYVFNFNPPIQVDQVGPPTVKFSLRIQNLGWDWGPSRGAKVADVPLSVTFKAAHSPYGGSIMQCGEESSLKQFCSSSTSDLDLDYNILSGRASANVTRKGKISLRYSYETQAAIDGASLTNAISVSVLKQLSGVVSTSQLTQYQYLNRSSDFNSLLQSEQNQSISLLLFASVPRFVNEFFYDPDVSIQLLFAPDLPPEADALPPATNTVAVVAGVLVGVAVAILGATIFAKFVFPYMKRNQSSVQEIEGTAAEESSRRWSAAKPAENITNQPR